MKADGFSDAEIAKARAFQRQKFQVAKTGLGWDTLDSTMKKLRTDSTRWFPGYGTGAATRSLASLRMYGVLQFNYDPARDLRKIKAPVLVIMGERDLVFPPQQVIDRMRGSLHAAGNTNYSARILPGVGHGMGTIQTIGGRPFRRVVSPLFLETLVSWVSNIVR
ncbi:MAG TPA: prolyl oligopeptidase family serine peptidase [Gemmatimonadaceae bacterium]|nr:prolyl oligopeptidase family serine peptidase [Gemmatimonadaceae bacterium]